jgi:hypothetical protein
MNLIVGENTYMTVEDANQLLSDFLVSSDPMKKYWDALSNDDKSVLIYSNTQKFDNDDMMYRWFKLDAEQPLQFPRIDINKKVIEVPNKIKLGLLINGIQTAMYSKDTDYTSLRDQGIRQYKIKDASVEFFSSADMAGGTLGKTSNGMYKSIFENYFKEFTVLV